MRSVNGIPVDNLVESVYHFNRIAAPIAPDRFNAERIGFYTGMQLEELSEKLHAIVLGCVTPHERERMATFANEVKLWGKEFKAGVYQGAVLRSDREELLDGDIDILVVSAGALVYQTPHFQSAVEHVLTKNAEKCPNGIATHDENGKIQKPDGWVKPNLAPFVDHHGE